MIDIVHGDSFELLKRYPDGYFDFVLWDPDYGVGIDYGPGCIDRSEAVDRVVKLLPEIRRVSKTGQAVMFWSGSIERVKAALLSEIDDLWPVHYMGIWYKPNGAGSSGNGLARRFETWFWLKDGPKPKSEWGHLPGVLEECRIVPGHKEAVQHPSQKPVGLYERLIRFFTMPGDTVLDPMLGSGTTAVACGRTGRKCVGIEINREYVAMAMARLWATQAPLITEPVAGARLFDDKPSPYDLSAVSGDEMRRRKRTWIDWTDKADPYDGGQNK